MISWRGSYIGELQTYITVILLGIMLSYMLTWTHHLDIIPLTAFAFQNDTYRVLDVYRNRIWMSWLRVCTLIWCWYHGGTTEEGNCSYLLPLSHRGYHYSSFVRMVYGFLKWWDSTIYIPMHAVCLSHYKADIWYGLYAYIYHMHVYHRKYGHSFYALRFVLVL